MTLAALLFGAVLASGGANGISLELSSDLPRIDPAKSLFLTVTLKTPRGVAVELPDLRDRAVGFSLAEDFVEEPETLPDGSSRQVANWRLVPEPAAKVYKLKPFAVENFIVGPVYFEDVVSLESASGDFEVVAKKDLPPLSWKLVGKLSLFALALFGVVFAIWRLTKYLFRRVKEHYMSPIERAWAELERLLKKELPMRGKYKDFYVELTLVVRRYIQRKYAINAPHQTTEEFLAKVVDVPNLAELSNFLTSADLIKFAGVEATTETAERAVESARAYLKGDAAV